MRRRRRTDQQKEQIVELEQVLEPYGEQMWNDPEEEMFADSGDANIQVYADGEHQFYGEEYSEEHEAADSENHFHLAIGMFDMLSIIIGIAVVFVLAGMLITLFNWLRNDILHSALLLQSGLK